MRFLKSYCTHKLMRLNSIPLANGIPIEGWTQDPNDEALLDLLPVLDSLRFTGDVRHVLGLRGFWAFLHALQINTHSNNAFDFALDLVSSGFSLKLTLVIVASSLPFFWSRLFRFFSWSFTMQNISKHPCIMYNHIIHNQDSSTYSSTCKLN